jgi:hypothetical protein
VNALSLYPLGHWYYQQRVPLVPTHINFDTGGRWCRWVVPVMEDRARIPVTKFVTFPIGGTERQVVNIGKDLDWSRFDIRFAPFSCGRLLEVQA